MSPRWLLRRVNRRLRRDVRGFIALALTFAGIAALGAGAHTLAGQSARSAARLAGQAHLSAYLDGELPAERARALGSAFRRLPAVMDVRQVDGSNALSELERQLGALGAEPGEPATSTASMLADLEPGFLPTSLEIVLSPGPELERRAADVASRLRRMPGVSAVDAMTDGLDRVAAFQSLARRLALFLAAAALAAALGVGGIIVARERIRRLDESRALALVGVHPFAAWLPAAAVWALAAALGGSVGLGLGRTIAANLFDPTLAPPALPARAWLLALLLLLAAAVVAARLSMPAARVLPLLVLLAGSGGGAARAEDGSPLAAAVIDPVDPVERVARRELLLSARASEAALRARASALHAYRLSRRGTARFVGAPEARGKDARASNSALLVFRRYVQEAHALRGELARARDERQALEAAAAAAVTATPADQFPHSDIVQPARGTIVARPGVRRDPATSALHRVTGLEILSRLNQPIAAPRAGTVRRVEPLPQGGFAVVTAHDENLVSVLTGLRRVDVQPGDVITRGQPLGACGRNLDGAPMITFELWKDGVPVSLAAPAATSRPPTRRGRDALAPLRPRPRI